MIKKRTMVTDIAKAKGKTPIVALTAYSAPFAKILDNHADILLVGDSLGMVIYGMESTLPVSMEMMIAHGRAVAEAATQACVVVDMPFGSYQPSKKLAFKNAARLMSETGCSAVKLEGGVNIANTIKFLTSQGIPVMGHIGLQPQSVNSLGGYKYQGKNAEEYQKILADAKAIEKAGAFAVVLEGVTEKLADEITATLAIPTIGIGASASCDGQVLVTEDMAGLFDVVPKFVRRYGYIKGELEKAAESFAADVRKRKFPTAGQCFEANKEKRKKPVSLKS